MAKNIMEKPDNNLKQLIKCCSNTLDNLQKLHEQLGKIIEAKKKQTEITSENVEFSKAQPAAVTNLEEIKKAVLQATDRMKQVYEQATVLLQKPYVKPGVSKTTATLGTTEEEIDEDKD